MKIDKIKTNQNINFKANFFKVEKYGQVSAIYICTDNKKWATIVMANKKYYQKTPQINFKI